jgi:hypothetical protein
MSINKKEQELTAALFFIPKENKELAKQVIALYQNRKVKNISTAKNYLTKLSKKLTPNKLKQIELEIKSYDKKTFTYDTLKVLWKKTDATQKKEVAAAQDIAEKKKNQIL